MKDGQEKLARIRLVARTRMAWEHARSAPSASARSAQSRFSALNRALALLALQRP